MRRLIATAAAVATGIGGMAGYTNGAESVPHTSALHGAIPRTGAGERRAAGDGAVTAEYEHILSTHGPALVTIRYVQKTETRFGDSEGENEITGVMVDPGGLVLCSNTLLGGGRRFGRAVPTEIKVLIGDDPEGLEAHFAARDSELDLAWLQIRDAGARRFAALDLDAALEQGAAPQLGERLLALARMGRYFGRELLVSEGVVAGRTRKPRELLVVRGGLDTDPGLPVFTTHGQLAGFACFQQPEPEEAAGNVANLAARGRGLLLPVDTVVKATRRAKEAQTTDEPLPPAEPAPPDDE